MAACVRPCGRVVGTAKVWEPSLAPEACDAADTWFRVDCLRFRAGLGLVWFRHATLLTPGRTWSIRVSVCRSQGLERSPRD
jgi:hypothetical protein